MSAKSGPKTRRYASAGVLLSCVLVSCSVFSRASANAETGDARSQAALRVYLPREVTVEDGRLSLGRISIIRGGDALAAKAGEITLGQITVPGQKITIDRATILSRLACSGIPASKVTLTGAEKITVKQHQQTVSGSQLVALAGSFLKSNPPAASVCKLNPIRMPKDFIIPGTGKDIKLQPRLAASGARNQAKVRIAVLCGDEEIGQAEVVFALKYDYRQAVTKVDIPAGGIISTENVKIETAPSDFPEPAGWRPPYGLTARRRLAAKTALSPNMVGPYRSPIIIKRNQNVLIRIERPGFVVTAIGKTMQDGRAGECIKVRNVDSQRTVLVRINEDGSVEPVS